MRRGLCIRGQTVLLLLALLPAARVRADEPPAAPPSEDPVRALLDRAGLASDTLALLTNLASTPVYALHGDADDNVPVSEMRTITERLRALGGDVTVHEQPGAGHWWDVSAEPGADCVDWKPLLERYRGLLARESRPEPTTLDFATAHPGVSARCRWATIESAIRPFVRCQIRGRVRADEGMVEVATENIERLRLDFVGLPTPQGLTLRIDDQPLELGDARSRGRDVRLRRVDGRWQPDVTTSPADKGPARCGPFKAAFDHGFQLVYGTAGTPEENAWSLAKARCDAEAWTYRANGRTDLVSDVDFLAHDDRERNAILYGHREMNRAWELLQDAPVNVRRGALRVGARTLEGEDLACLSVLPRPHTDTTSIGIVAGTGLPGLRLCQRLPYFTSGVPIPDLVILSSRMLVEGDRGLLGAGFFGNDWSVERGTWAWR